jgi:GR25 family glycosyltransferase involved in LPS biosynthesis
MSLSKHFDFIEEIWCINLDHRTDRWTYAQSEFDRLGIKNRVQRFSAIKHENPKFGLVQSFLTLLKYAKEKKLKNILIFEDDITFSSNEEIDNVMSNVNAQLLGHDDWEMLFFGAMIINNVQYADKNLIRLTNGLCAHAICYRAPVYDDLIKQLSVLDDVKFEQDAYDWFTLKMQFYHPTYLVAPMIAHQQPSYSDLEKTFIDKDNQIKELFKMYTQPKRVIACPPGHSRTDYTFDFASFLLSREDVNYIKLQVASYSFLNKRMIDNVYFFYDPNIVSEADREEILMISNYDFVVKIRFIDITPIVSHYNDRSLDTAKLLISKFMNAECYVYLPPSYNFIMHTDQRAFIARNQPILVGTTSANFSEYEKCVKYFNTVNTFGIDILPDTSNLMTFFTDDVKSLLISIKEKFDSFIFNNDIHPLFLYIVFEIMNKKKLLKAKFIKDAIISLASYELCFVLEHCSMSLFALGHSMLTPCLFLLCVWAEPF